MHIETRSVSRDMTHVMLSSISLKKRFHQFTKLDAKYVDKVYDRYVYRVEGMFGRELERKSIERSKRSGGSLEQLRQVKGKINSSKKLKLT